MITHATLRELVSTLAALPASERGTVPGIKPGRGDIILAAAVVLERVVDVCGFAGIEATEAGLREGVFLGRVLLSSASPLIADVRGAAVRNLSIQYESDLRHVEHVARLSLQMFDSMVQAGLFTPRDDERELLWAASMLHDVGMTISYDDHHKHSRYLIESAELPGFDPRERALIAQITRYHRKGVPKLGAIEPLTEADDADAARSLLGDPAPRRAPRARPRPVGLRGAAAHQRRRRRPPSRGRRRPDAAALVGRALRRRRRLRARLRPPPADRLSDAAGDSASRSHDRHLRRSRRTYGAIPCWRVWPGYDHPMLWLLRHAEAADGTPDDERPLTERGIRQARDAGHALEALGVEIDACLASPKLRARQTAELACAPLGVEVTIDKRLSGEPFDAYELAAGLGDVLLVGHDPSFTLTLHQLTGAQARMRKGGLAAIAKGELVTLLRPAELAAIAGQRAAAS